MPREVENWLSSARYDLAVARDVLEAGRYPYVVFFCHLAVEKALKAKVQEVTGKTPPKVHDLVALLKLAQLMPPPQFLDFIGKLGGASKLPATLRISRNSLAHIPGRRPRSI